MRTRLVLWKITRGNGSLLVIKVFINVNLHETIRRILREELYSPSGDEHTPGKFIVHKSNPMWRKNISLTGLQTYVGDCYQQHVGEDVECKPSIFATDSLDKKQMFDSTTMMTYGLLIQNVRVLLGIKINILRVVITNTIS